MNHRKHWGRGAFAVAALGGVVVASSGCISLDNAGLGQNGVGSDLVFQETVCLSGSSGCGNADNIDASAAGTSGTGQLLVGYRVPDGYTPPATVTSDSPLVTATASASYTAELERLSPAGPGRKWAGYITGQFAYDGATDAAVELSSTWPLPGGTGGAPFEGPVTYRPVVGFRLSDATRPASRPVDCGASLGTFSDSSTTVCVDSPLLATLSAPDDALISADFGILTGAAATGPAGATVTVPFRLRYGGGIFPAAIAMTAATTLPGAAVTVTPGSLQAEPGSTNTVSVAVAVPAGTAPGTYDVSLTARAGMQARVRTGTLTVPAPVVTPPPATPPSVTTLRLGGSLPGRLTLLAARTKGVRVTVRSNRSGRAVVRLVQRRRILLARTVTLRNGATTVVLRSRRVVAGAYRVTVRFTATGRIATLKGTLRAG